MSVSRLLIDTHILLRWLGHGKLAVEQKRALDQAVKRGEIVAISAISLMEIALLASGQRIRVQMTLDEMFSEIESHPSLALLPITYKVASEVAGLASLRDPADRVIVATARVNRLRLVTSDARIIQSQLVAVL